MFDDPGSDVIDAIPDAAPNLDVGKVAEGIRLEPVQTGVFQCVGRDAEQFGGFRFRDKLRFLRILFWFQ